MDSLINLIYVEGDIFATLVNLVVVMICMEVFALVVSFLGRVR